jgi:UDP-glucuronate decarboxylase
MTIAMIGSKSKLASAPLPPDDPTRRQPDISLAKKQLNWQPTVPLRKGLEKTIAWFGQVDIDSYRPPTPNY